MTNNLDDVIHFYERFDGQVIFKPFTSIPEVMGGTKILLREHLQLYYRLKAINRNIKILFVPALDAVPKVISILPDVKAVDDVIKKPVALDDFISAAKIALDDILSITTSYRMKLKYPLHWVYLSYRRK